MAKTLMLSRLDYMTVRPYLSWKNILIILASSLIVTVSTKDTTMLFGMVTMFGTLMSINTFAVGEKNGIDTLYATLTLTRKQIVLGRYVFCYIVALAFAAVALLLGLALSLALSLPFNLAEMLAILAVCLGLFVTLQNVQLPIFFKLGYTRGRMATYVPILGLPALVFLISYLAKRPFFEPIAQFVSNNTTWLIVGAVVLFFVGCAVSCALSIRFYGKRDL